MRNLSEISCPLLSTLPPGYLIAHRSWTIPKICCVHMILPAAPLSKYLVVFQNCRPFLKRRTLVLDAPLALNSAGVRTRGKRRPRRYLGKATQTLSEHRAWCPQRLAVSDSHSDDSPTSSRMLSSASPTSVALLPLSSSLFMTLSPDAPCPPLSSCLTILPLLQPLQPLPLPQTPYPWSNSWGW